ncbi:sensor histidine kinase [Neomicrococcus lactis]|uniref:sensor histidine kinase n=1 Tax=Neomicrococcus lactis TaxID=732241 RepID=UPI002300EA4E|nr:sensor histidine kinase [Neomicrococcus lactis]
MSPTSAPANEPFPAHRELRRRHPRHLTLASQFLLLQLLIVAAVVVGTMGFSFAQSTAAFERTESRRALAVAETLASMPTVRALMPDENARHGAALPAVTQSTSGTSGFEYVFLADTVGNIVSSSQPTLLDDRLPVHEWIETMGRAVTGPLTIDHTDILMARVPIMDDGGKLVGIAGVARVYPTVLERIEQSLSNVIVYGGLALGSGAIGSLLLSNRVKRQTFGMEPQEIAELANHLDTVVNGVKEGIVALDSERRITLINQPAEELLNLPAQVIGERVEDIAPNPLVARLLTSDQETPDRLVIVGQRLLAFNRKMLVSFGKPVGSVTTIRDHTELATLERELGLQSTSTEMMRAQTHEFANQLHTISGLIQLEEYDEVVNFVDGVRLSMTKLNEEVTSTIHDPSIAALLIAKASIAAERNIDFDLTEDSSLPRLPDVIAREFTTVIGNLIDNAMDAVHDMQDRHVSVTVVSEAAPDAEKEQVIHLTVRDSGNGVSEELMDKIFIQGFSTKDDDAAPHSQRGFGLALTKLICERQGGSVTVRNGGNLRTTMSRGPGAVFEAHIPWSPSKMIETP